LEAENWNTRTSTWAQSALPFCEDYKEGKIFLGESFVPIRAL